MNVQQKDLVLLPFPFSNLEGTKVRPALVVSNDSFNKKSDDCIMVPLTTIIKEEPFSVIINQEDLSAGRLLRSSRVRADKLFTVEKNLAIMKIGVVNDKTFDRIKKEILRIF
ncbi:type II toxin-antitoxin system PemK/MazF family toxin [Candidatus Pacearchaeota archaeon]|nr:type II toxin-antitoxin system PemK/MazF family toxin [Candidatus Pacearchaeota archaeon]